MTDSSHLNHEGWTDMTADTADYTVWHEARLLRRLSELAQLAGIDHGTERQTAIKRELGHITFELLERYEEADGEA